MSEEWNELEAAAKAATPGPWNWSENGGITQTSHITRDVWEIPRTEQDCVFIALANPETVLRLIAEVRRLEKTHHAAAIRSGK